jgi:hypothetical protein
MMAGGIGSANMHMFELIQLTTGLEAPAAIAYYSWILVQQIFDERCDLLDCGVDAFALLRTITAPSHRDAFILLVSMRLCV